MAYPKAPENDLFPGIRAKLVESCMPLAYKIALQYKQTGRYYGLQFEDLLSGCYYGLIEASKRWDRNRGVPFFYYAKHWVMCWVRKVVLEQRWFGTCGLGTIGGDPNDPQPPIRLSDAREGGSTSDYSNKAHLHTLSEVLSAVEPEESEGDTEDWWCQVMNVLPDNEKWVIAARYRDGLTLEEAGLIRGVCRERVRQLEVRAINRLRTWFMSHLELNNTIAGQDHGLQDIVRQMPRVYFSVKPIEQSVLVKKIRRMKRRLQEAKEYYDTPQESV